MKLLWHSNSPWSSTGYGNQTGLFAPRLNGPYDLRVSSFYGLSGAPLHWEDVVVLPGIDGTYGNEMLLPHALEFFGDLRGGTVITLMDVWVLDPAVCRQLNMACWVPVDHDPTPPRVIEFFRASGAIPIAMTRFGQSQLSEFDPLYVPHAVDTETFKPQDKLEARRKLGVDPDAFVVGMVAANKGNPSRKCFSEALQAFAAFRREHPKALLYLHTDIRGEISGGVPIGELIQALQIPEDAISIPNQYRVLHHPPGAASMAMMYATMDVLLNPSMGEGFGIPVLEAQACGIPCVVTDATAMSEVCEAGWKVEGTRTWTPQRSWQFTPSVPKLIDALEAAHGLNRTERRQMARQARKHALKYDIGKVMADHMLPAIAEVEDRFAARKPEPLKAIA